MFATSRVRNPSLRNTNAHARTSPRAPLPTSQPLLRAADSCAQVNTSTPYPCNLPAPGNHNSPPSLQPTNTTFPQRRCLSTQPVLYLKCTVVTHWLCMCYVHCCSFFAHERLGRWGSVNYQKARPKGYDSHSIKEAKAGAFLHSYLSH